jgi:hypothetical protein
VVAIFVLVGEVKGGRLGERREAVEAPVFLFLWMRVCVRESVRVNVYDPLMCEGL